MAWKLRRLQAMSVSELSWRLKGAFAMAVERFRVELGWQPKSRVVVGSGPPLFEPFEGWQAQWERYFELDESRLEELLRGRIELFGVVHDVGHPIDWLRDPLTRNRSRTTYGKTLDYRDESQVGNIKFLWELGRHQHLAALASAYAVTGDQRYRDAITDHIESWIQQNPFCMGVHWCSSLELALRLVSWAFCHGIVSLRVGSRGLFDLVADSTALGTSIYQQCRFVRAHHSRYSSANNHLIGELTGVYVACSVFELGPEGSQWRHEAALELAEQARRQVYPDGASREQSTYYHLWVLEYLLLATLIGRKQGDGIADDLVKIVLRMRSFLEDLTPTGGRPPAIGDSDDGAVTRFELAWPSDPYSDVTAAVDAAIEVGRHPKSASQKGFWYSWLAFGRPRVESSASSGTNEALSVYPDAGYGILRAGPAHLVFDAGSLGFGSLAAHGHADALSICLAVEGIWWLGDPGTYCYHDQPEWRDYFRGTAAHNTIRIDGRDQGEIGGPFLWSRQYDGQIEEPAPTESCYRLVGTHDGYRPLGCTHRRAVELDFDGLTVRIVDTIEGHGNHEMESFLHLLPGVNWRVRKGNRIRLWQPHAQYELTVQFPSDWSCQVLQGSEDPIAGWFSERLEAKVPAPVLIARRTGSLPVEVITEIQIQGRTTAAASADGESQTPTTNEHENA